MIVQFKNEKVSNHGSIPITIDCNVVAFIVFEERFHQPIKRTKQIEELVTPNSNTPLSIETVSQKSVLFPRSMQAPNPDPETSATQNHLWQRNDEAAFLSVSFFLVFVFSPSTRDLLCIIDPTAEMDRSKA
ncbi:hypothetical protein TNCV_5040391 [Trichonephila clavipes]|nr:hypothetical protein TNCV_5040391 [Trichonephila clavipes]